MTDLTREGLAARGLRIKPLEWADLDATFAPTPWGEYAIGNAND